MKEIKIIVEIDEDGIIHAHPEGTEGEECLEILSLLSKVKGLELLSTEKNDDFDEREVEINTRQSV